MTNVLSSCRESLRKENALSKCAFSSERALNTPRNCEQCHEINSLQVVKDLSIYYV